jgi:hypothetical protein
MLLSSLADGERPKRVSAKIFAIFVREPNRPPVRRLVLVPPERMSAELEQGARRLSTTADVYACFLVGQQLLRRRRLAALRKEAA